MTICKSLKVIALLSFFVLAVVMITGMYVYEGSYQEELARKKAVSAVNSINLVFSTLHKKHSVISHTEEPTVNELEETFALMSGIQGDKELFANFQCSELWIVIDDPLDGLVFSGGGINPYPEIKPSDYFAVNNGNEIKIIKVNRGGVPFYIALRRNDSDLYDGKIIFGAASNGLTPIKLFLVTLRIAFIPLAIMLLLLLLVARVIRRILVGYFNEFNNLLDKLERTDEFDFSAKGCFATAEQHQLVEKIRSMKQRAYSAIEEADAFREKAEVALRSIGEGILVASSKGEVVLINNEAEKILGCKNSDVVGESFTSVFKLIDSKSREFVTSPIQTVLNTKVSFNINSGVMVVSKDGVEYLIALNASPVINKFGEIDEVILVFRNITEEVMKQETLQNSNELLRSNAADMSLILGVAKIAMWEFNIETKRIEAGKDFSDLLHIEEKDSYSVYDDLMPRISNSDEFIDVINDDMTMREEGFSLKNTFRGDDGVDRWIVCSGKAYNVNERGTVERIRGVLVDITENVESQQAIKSQNKVIQASNKRLQQVYNLAKMLFWEYDVVNDIVTGDTNFCELILSDVQDNRSACMKSVFDKIDPAYHEMLSNTIAEKRKNRERECIAEFALNPDSKNYVRYYRNYFHFEYGEDYSATYSYGLALDITEERERQARQIQASKMESIGLLSGGIAHDFNNMLSGISGMVELLELNVGGNDDKAVGYCQNIKKACVDAAALTKQLLLFSRNNVENYEEINLKEVLNNTKVIIQHSMSKNVNLSFDIRVTAPYIIGDFSEIQNSLLNLAINARDAMIDINNPRISIVIDKFGEANSDAILCCGSIVEGREYVVIEVSDNGKGIDASKITKIFEPFYTSKLEGNGTGLGLSVLAETVISHEGAVFVKSELGIGTTFSLVIPLAHGEVRVECIENPINDSVIENKKMAVDNSNHGYILVVDDEPMMRVIYRQILVEHGYDVLEAESGRDGVEKFSKHSSEIHGVIMDLQMPGMDGREAFEKIKKIDDNVKVVFVSGYLGRTKKQDLIDLGALMVLAKPFRKKSFISNISSLFG